MQVTDIIVITFLLIQSAVGAWRGFLHTLAGPASLIISLAVSWLFYMNTRNLPVTLGMNVVLPLILSTTIHNTLNARHDDNMDPRLLLLSRMAGQIINTLWGALIAVACVVILSVLPLERYELSRAQNDVRQSYTLRLVRPFLQKKKLLPEVTPREAIECLNDTCSMDMEKVAAIGRDPELQAIINDPRIKKLTSDPAFIEAGSKRDIPALLKIPAVMELTRDPELISKLFQLFPKLQALEEKSAHAPLNSEAPAGSLTAEH